MFNVGDKFNMFAPRIRAFGGKIPKILSLELNVIIHKILVYLSLGWQENSIFGNVKQC